MPTNILRNRPKPVPSRGIASGDDLRGVAIRAGRALIRATLLDTPTAARIAAALPLHTTAETWGAALHFEIPVASGRERGARLNAVPGDIMFWSSERRIILPFGPTPISRAGEVRLPSPCNVWARAIDDVGVLRGVQPGEKVSITALID